MKKNLQTVIFLLIFTCSLLLVSNSYAQLTFTIPSNTNLYKATVDIPITTKNFTGVAGIQGSINWDNTKFTYNTISAPFSTISGTTFNHNITGSTGYLTFAWSDPNANAQNIPDNTVLFTLTLNVIYSTAQNTTISFSNTPTAIGAFDNLGNNINGIVTNNGAYHLSALPLQLIDFSAKGTSSGVQLDWLTAAEVKVSYMDILRSTDAVKFTKVGTIAAKGAGQYSFTDASVPSATSKLYYRLLIADMDGLKQESKIVSVNLNNLSSSVAVYPNPVSSILNATVESGNNESVTVTITDIDGRVVVQQETKLIVGVNNISVPVSTLTHGYYSLTIGANKSTQKRFLKL